jgi:UDP-2-acetamido-2-deoxy-ribo-hexuluronate aminotransferase
MQVPFIDLGRLVDKVKVDVQRDWQECLDATEFVGGPSVAKLERQLEEDLSVNSLTSCSSGTDALTIALRALGIGQGMRVAMPNMTFWAPYEAVVQVGAEPILIDSDPDDLQMCFDEFQEAHERFRFDAAILVHLFGWGSSQLAAYRAFCGENHIILIEDGAQCFGARYDGEPLIANATVGTLSFYPAKVLGASGDAGAITANDIKVGDRIRALCNHGRAGHYTYDYVGFNSRLGALQARFLLRVLDLMPEILASRRRAEAFYQEFFRDHEDLCRVYRCPEGMTSNGYLSVLTMKRTTGDEVVRELSKLGIGAARTYPQTLNLQPPARKAIKASDLRISREFSQKVVNLPLFSFITIEECQAAAEALLKVLRK